MTRINLVDPQYLINDHLMAEYRELPRIFRAVIVLEQKNVNLRKYKFPRKFRLGEGHMKFFYRRCKWLAERWVTIKEELIHRGYNLDPEYIQLVQYRISVLPAWSWGEYQPTPEDIYLSMERITGNWRTSLERKS